MHTRGEASGQGGFASTPGAHSAVPVVATTRLLPIATAANEMGWTEMAPAEKGGVTATRERVRNTHTRHNDSKEIRRDQIAPPPPAPWHKRPRRIGWTVTSYSSNEALARYNTDMPWSGCQHGQICVWLNFRANWAFSPGELHLYHDSDTKSALLI